MHVGVGFRPSALVLERMLVTSERPGSECVTPLSGKAKVHLAVSLISMQDHLTATFDICSWLSSHPLINNMAPLLAGKSRVHGSGGWLYESYWDYQKILRYAQSMLLGN